MNNRLPDGYVVIGTYSLGADNARLLSANGLIVLFETVAMAQQFAPLLGCGRETTFAAGGEKISWSPLDPRGINRAVIITDYDPYNLPANFSVSGVKSETKTREWKHHVMWFHAFFDCGQHAVDADGNVRNLALPDLVDLPDFPGLTEV